MNDGRLKWQCRRGMRELDVLLTSFLDECYANSDQREKRAFRQLLTLSDPELNAYLLGDQLPADPDIAHVVALIRSYPSS